MLGVVKVGHRYLNLSHFAEIDVDYPAETRCVSLPTGVALHGLDRSAPPLVLRDSDAEALRAYLASLEQDQHETSEFGSEFTRFARIKVLGGTPAPQQVMAPAGPGLVSEPSCPYVRPVSYTAEPMRFEDNKILTRSLALALHRAANGAVDPVAAEAVRTAFLRHVIRGDGTCGDIADGPGPVT